MQEEVIIIGGGPCGMAAAIALQKYGINALIIEKENIVNSLYRFPTHQTFFSSSEKLEIGDVAFITEKQRPVRNEALTYYREVARRKDLRINAFETVTNVSKSDGNLELTTVDRQMNENKYNTKQVIVATGYYDQPNRLHIPGEDLPKVAHYFKEAHPYYKKDVVIIGGKNSAVDAALELHKAGANVTVLYRGAEYSSSIKPWILPSFDSLAKKDLINVVFNAKVSEITEESVSYHVAGEQTTIDNDFVFAMIGYQPNIPFLHDMGIETDKTTGIPAFDEKTYESNVENIYLAGVVTAGFNNNAIFIENGRFHGDIIAKDISKKLVVI